MRALANLPLQKPLTGGGGYNANENFAQQKNCKNALSKTLLFVAIAINLAILFLFKYLGFSCTILYYIFSILKLPEVPIINFALPIGISFYTFQEISYLVDVYKDKSLVQKNILNLGLYITFFPQLIAGPIVRYHDINCQIQTRKENLDDIYNGFVRFIVGLSKKVLIANNMALVCDAIYGADFSTYGTLASWIACFAYTMQIYYDFSGYSDMAIGLARIFGFKLKENFNYPYFANSITDFWKRWHISLTSFFRDYVYIPLGGNKKGKMRTMCNRFAVFFLTGLWHGASFNFVLWGLAHGFLMVVERFLGLDKFFAQTQTQIDAPVAQKRTNFFCKKAFAVLYRIFVLFVIMLLWVLFRNGTSFSLQVFKRMFYLAPPQNVQPLFLFCVDTKFYIISICALVFATPLYKMPYNWLKNFYQKICARYAKLSTCKKSITLLHTIAKDGVLLALFLLCFAFLATESYNPFIYFRF